MALTADVSPGTVTMVQPKLYSMVYHLSLLNNSVEVLAQDFAFDFRTGDSVPSKLTEVGERIQRAIDTWKDQEARRTAAAFINGAETIQAALVLT